jgi:hypothetical protein
MKKQALILSALLLTAAAAAVTPAAAADVRPVQNTVLSHFIGSTLFGAAHANLGVISAVSPVRGEVALVGRHGELVAINTSMLVRDGWNVYAPKVTVGDVAAASNLRIPITQPTIRVIE